MQKWVEQKIKIFVGSRISKILRPVKRYDDFKLIRITCQPACHGKTEHGIFCQVLKNEQNCCRVHCWCHHLGYSVPPAHHCTIWCRSTFGSRGPGLSNPTSFLRPALPMAPTTDDNPRDERSVLRPNPATFLRDFMLYMTTNNAIIWKRCLRVHSDRMHCDFFAANNRIESYACVRNRKNATQRCKLSLRFYACVCVKNLITSWPKIL